MFSVVFLVRTMFYLLSDTADTCSPLNAAARVTRASFQEDVNGSGIQNSPRQMMNASFLYTF
jgi:hypothetical protein